MASQPIPPPPVNPPPPPPPSAQSPAIFPNVTTNTDFATLGLAGSVRDGFSVKFDAASNTYVIGLPSRTPGAFIADPNSETNTYWNGSIQGSARGDKFSVFKPSASNPDIQLAYTSYGIASGYYSGLLDFVAFGSATPASGIPVSGSATYGAIVAGTADSSGTNYPTKTIGGTATLQFDFGAGTLAGHFDPILTFNSVKTSLGTYSFVNTVYGVGKTGFSGQLSISGASSPGSFDGQFTGPAAQELMARWTAPYLMPGTQQWSQMFGVWVGKKH